MCLPSYQNKKERSILSVKTSDVYFDFLACSSKKSEIRKDEIDYAANSSMKRKSDKQSQKST